MNTQLLSLIRCKSEYTSNKKRAVNHATIDGMFTVCGYMINQRDIIVIGGLTCKKCRSILDASLPRLAVETLTWRIDAEDNYNTGDRSRRRKASK